MNGVNLLNPIYSYSILCEFFQFIDFKIIEIKQMYTFIDIFNSYYTVFSLTNRHRGQNK